MADTFVINAAAIRRLANNPAVVAEFPFLKPYAQASASRRRGCCPAAGPDPQRAVMAVASLPPDRKTRLKQLVGADRVVIMTVRAARVVRQEF